MQSNLRCFKVLLVDVLCTRSRASAVNKQRPAVSWPDLTSRSFFREMTAEAKNASSVNRREECKAQKAPDQLGVVQPAGADHRNPSIQSGARISHSPANRKPRSGPLPVAFSLSATWAVAERAGRLLNSPRPLSSPSELWKQHGYCVLSDPLKSNRSNGQPESIICDQINAE